MTLILLAGLLLVLAAPLDLDPDELKPGLVAEYRSLGDPKAIVLRVDPKAAFTLGRSSPHPRLPPGPFEVAWTGVLSVREPGPLTFSALVGGELVVTVDGIAVLEGRGTTETTRLTAKRALDRGSGIYPVTIKYRSLAD